MDSIICVLFFFASRVVKDFSAAFVAQKINAGVSISPCGVEIFPVHALLFLFVLLTFQEKLVISFWDKKLSYINKRSVKYGYKYSKKISA